ncbi:Putative type II secretion system protein E [Sodalis glossinidius str. 'morsitans']|uniref:Type II secretion system protein E n=1 Tax=Sodalis glossinidius (strain morsitans) TaxID=343509 RepID=A0A193QG54_SODGM|nr:Putative type II secretion system protein E [Sodalis glossinidius str. 'morsitans']
MEDPVELPLTGINQCQVNSRARLDFPLLLRALLRQDPDVLMVGEIRDPETAAVTLNAARTGYLVLSTLHTLCTDSVWKRRRHGAGAAGHNLVRRTQARFGSFAMNGLWLWRWQGLCAEGRFCRGKMIGRSRRDCGMRLVAQGYQPFRLRIHCWLPARYWQRRALITLTDRLASLLHAGLPLRESLTLLAAEYPRAGWRCLLAQIGADIERGLTLSRACAAWPQVFPPVWCAMFALGELTGRLDSCCAELAQSEARLWRIRQQVMRSLLVSLGAVGDGCAIIIRAGVTRLRTAALWLPLAGPLLRHHTLHQLFQTLSMTHRAGIALDRALAPTSLFPAHCHWLIRSGGLTGTLDEILSQLARLHGEQARQNAEQLAQLAEPALLLLTGAMVCGLVVMLYLPLLQLEEVFSQF